LMNLETFFNIFNLNCQTRHNGLFNKIYKFIKEFIKDYVFKISNFYL